MKKLASEQISDWTAFTKALSLYIHKRLHRGWAWFEIRKDVLVNVLTAKRGLYQRPFLHTSLLLLIGAAIMTAPLIASNSTVAEELGEYTPPSAVLSAFDEQATLTEISEKPRDKVISYTVVEGDTISTVAEKFGISTDTIKWANSELKGDKLTIGQALNIPPVTGLVIKVKKGETISSIAKKYQVDAQQIVNFPFNEFDDLDTFALAAGQTLVVPDGVVPEAKPIYSPQTIAAVGVTPGSGQFAWPTNGTITQRPVGYHMAVDIANRGLPAILAADGGKVISVQYLNYGYGYHVIVDHGNGYQTLYGHMSAIYVNAGQSVGKGTTLGKMGSTGRSSGPHLHFEIRKNGVLLNPLGFLQ